MMRKRKKEKAYKATTSIHDRQKTIGNNLNFAAAEAYKLLRTNLMFSMTDESECKIIGVTSALRGEGKSTTSMNLAYTLAENGKRVLLIEADMRIPVVASVLSIEASPGLSNVLAGLNNLNDAVRGSGLLENFAVMPAGEIPPNPSEMLSSKRMGVIVESLAKVFEYIIIDLPPLTAVSDGLVVSKLLSGMVMVVRQNYCDQHSLAEAMCKMEFLHVKLLGFVMNYAESPQKRYYKYGYRSYRYGDSQKYGDVYGSKGASSDSEYKFTSNSDHEPINKV